MEAKYIASSMAIQEDVWLRIVLWEFDIVVQAEKHVTIYYDSSTAIAYSKNPKLSWENQTQT